MTLDIFKKLLSKQPFEPFRIVMSSGEKYAIMHPEAAFLTRHTLYVGTDFDNMGIPGDSAWCSLIHITAVEPVSNGRHRRRAS